MSESIPRRASRGVDRSAQRASVSRTGAATSAKRTRGAARQASASRARDAKSTSIPKNSSTGAANTVAGRLVEAVSAHRAQLAACVVVVVVLAALYAPTCGLYQAWREHGLLQAEQAQAATESAELESDIDALMTEDGIKDEARKRGYVEEGETRIVVNGASSDEDASADQDAQDDAEDTPWYLELADTIFQYDAEDEGAQ